MEMVNALTIFYWIIAAFLMGMYLWTLFTTEDKNKQINCSIIMVPFLLRLFFIH